MITKPRDYIPGLKFRLEIFNLDNGKVRQFRKPANINIGIIVFLVILFYIIVCTFMYFTSKHIIGYQVKTGSLSVSNVYEGIALRDEVIVNSTGAGYINYYAREGEKVGMGNVVCTLDESGELQDLINKSSADGEANLSEQDLSELKNEMINFVSSFDKANFSTVYDFKFNIEGAVLKFSNKALLENLNELNARHGSGLVSFCTAPESGIVVYSIDGFEDKSPMEVDESWFDKTAYEKKQLINNSIADVGDIIYKLSDNERWSILIPVERERAEELLEEQYVRVKFLKNQYESWGRVEIIEGTDGNTYVQLNFTNSMFTFVTDRFIDIELITNQQTGLKVPNSAIIEKQFYLIPTEYVTKGNNSSTGVLKETYGEDGTSNTEFIPISIYAERENEYYIDDENLKVGDRIDKPDSVDSYTISKVANLTGVFSINKGYADFKQIQVLNNNDEYSIIKSNTDYGLVAYDYIVLDATSVESDEFIYD